MCLSVCVRRVCVYLSQVTTRTLDYVFPKGQMTCLHTFTEWKQGLHSAMRPTHQILPLITSSRLFGCQHTCDTLTVRYEHEPHHVCRGGGIRDMNRKQNGDQEAHDKLWRRGSGKSEWADRWDQQIQQCGFYTMNQPQVLFNTDRDSIMIPYYETFCFCKRWRPACYFSLKKIQSYWYP